MSFQAELYTNVLKELIAATHCHSCGHEYPVSILGYVGRHCDKYCWKSLFYKTYNDCILENCEFCINERPFSLAHSKYHILWNKVSSKNGYYWPMCTYKKECNNECIKNTTPIAIPGYNY
jgi:hypothetical protein